MTLATSGRPRTLLIVYFVAVNQAQPVQSSASVRPNGPNVDPPIHVLQLTREIFTGVSHHISFTYFLTLSTSRSRHPSPRRNRAAKEFLR